MKTPKEIIKKLTQLGFSQKEISHHTGIPQPTLSRILNSDKSSPRWQTVYALNSFLETVNNFEDENI